MIENYFDIMMDVPLFPFTMLHAGELSCIYEAGNLRYIKSGNAEIVRMVYGAVRNQHWETISPIITDEFVEDSGDHFYISYTALYHDRDVQYEAAFVIEGKADNSIEVTMKGKSLGDFKKNRIGLCVLHPLRECKGKAVTVVQPGGERYTAQFPELVAPHHPLSNIQQLLWNPAEGVQATLNFSGDIFETEDQRNWSDSSFKTYSTPSYLPIPADVKAGETIGQKVTLSVTGQATNATEKSSFMLAENVRGKKANIGYYPHGAGRLSKEQAEYFSANNFTHYRAEVDVYNSGWQQQLNDAVAIAKQLRTRLELVLFFKKDYGQPLKQFLQQAATVAEYIDAILLLDRAQAVTPPALMRTGYEAIKAAFPFIKTGYGTDAYFAALNRNRPGDLPHDFVSFSLMPQAHATDTRTIIENLESLPDIIQTIQSFTGNSIHISPLSIGKRVNPDAVDEKDYFITATDPRSRSAFEAGWKQYCIHQLQQADSITLLQSF